jgi:hypothetical protein
MLRSSLGVLLVIICSTIGCGDSPRTRADARDSALAAPPPPKPKVWEPRPVVAPPDTPKDSLSSDTTAADSVSDSTAAKRDSAPPRTRARGPRPFVLSPADSAKWPVKTPDPLPGSLLPEHRIIAYYGNPLSTRMGIMGQVPPDSMLPRLEQVAMEWALADPERKVMPALHLIATVAQGKPGAGKKYRLRMTDSLINMVASWAEERGWIVFLDIQTGHSTVAAEIEPLIPFLQRPYVHLALDPEFAMKRGGVPGRRVGTLDAEDVNHAIEVLGEVVTEQRLPPKVLIVHRFTRKMLTNTDSIRLDPRVQVVIQMDGFGSPHHKQKAYRFWISPHPVQYTGFKLFYKNDKPMMTPEQVLRLWPAPVYIQYQ